ncbi:hypothetical protein TNCV_1777131 [Trichonephila clavipes]|nr:hypothetical protein TNCV_1777131 [Trichonephila clavipes]
MKPEVYNKVQFALSKRHKKEKFNLLFVDHQRCLEFEPSTTQDPPCREEMHVKSVESSNVLLLEWCGS